MQIVPLKDLEPVVLGGLELEPQKTQFNQFGVDICHGEIQAFS